MENYIFEKMPVPKAYMQLAIPVVMSMIVSMVYNMVDTYFIALTGVTELIAGVSLAAPIFTLMIAFGDIWGLGGSSLISRLFGERKDEEAKKVSAFCFWAAILFGICVTMVLLIFRGPILSLLGAGEDTLRYASAYYTWIAIGAAAIILGLVPTNILRTEGLATQAMVGSFIGSIANMILDPVFIFVLKQGAAGAAIATVLGNVLADLYYVYVILKKSRRLSVSWKDISVNKNMLYNIMMIGIPASITNIMQSFMLMMTNQFLLPYGTDKVAAMGIALKANTITAFILIGFAFGGQPLIGYNFGARNHKRFKEILRFAYGFAIAVSIVFTLLICLMAPLIMSIFVKDAGIIANGASMLRCQQISMLFIAVILVSTCVCQSVGNARGAYVLSLSRQGVIYVLMLVILSRIAGYHGVILSQAASDVVTAVIGLLIVKAFLKFKE